MLTGAILAVPALDPAPAGAQPGGYRGLEGLSFGSVRDLEVSEAHNRIVIAGDDRIELYSLDGLQLVATVDGFTSVPGLRLHGASLFVADASDGMIREISLIDGTTLNQWPTGAPGIRSLDVTDTVVWFANPDAAWFSGLGRIDRASGQVDAINVSSGQPALVVRVSPGRPDEVFLMQGGPFLTQYAVAGVDATRIAGAHGSIGLGLEISLDGVNVWSTSRSEFELNIENFLPVRNYDRPHHIREFAVERSQNSGLALWNGDWSGGELVVLDRDVATARNVLKLSGNVWGLAISTTEVFSVVEINGAVLLHVWTLDYAKPSVSQPPRVPLGDGLGYRGLTSLGFDEVTDIAVSDAENRLVVAGDDRVEIFRLDNFALIASVDGIYQASEIRLEADRFFVLARADGVIREVSLADGTVLNRWELSVAGIWSIDVSPTHVWFAHQRSSFGSGIGRLERATGLVEAIPLADDPSRQPLVRVRDGHPDEVYVGSLQLSPGWLHRYEVIGTIATVLADPVGSRFVQSLEVSADGATAWAGGGRSSAMAKVDGSTMAVTALGEFSQSAVTDVWVGPLADSAVVLATSKTRDGRVLVFDPETELLSNSLAVQGWLGAVAASSTEVFAVSGLPGSLTLHGWQLDYVPTDRTVTVLLAGHGSTENRVVPFRIACDEMDEVFWGSWGHGYVVTIPAGEVNCWLVPQPSGAQSTLLGTQLVDRWEFVEVQSVSFDPTKHSSIAIVSFFPSPVNNVHELVKQSYVDVAGRQASSSEVSLGVDQVVLGGAGRAGFVLGLMDYGDGYERVQAPIGRLYRAFFLRDSDQGGHEYWADQFASGVSIPWIAEYFASSEEFNLRYGDLNDREFVALVYQNVMSRVPDQGGYDYWLDQMGNGMTRGELMIYFSDSPEYRNYASGRVFAVYAARVLERSDPSEQDIAALVTIFDRSGRAAVVEAILAATPYYERFWIGDDSAAAGLLDPGLLDPDLSSVPLECVDCPSARELFEQFG